MDTVATESKWNTFWAAHNAYSNTPIHRIWDSNWAKTPYGTIEDLTVDCCSAEEIDRVSQEFGKVLSDGRPWDPDLFNEFVFDTLPVTSPLKAYVWYDNHHFFGSINSLSE